MLLYIAHAVRATRRALRGSTRDSRLSAREKNHQKVQVWWDSNSRSFFYIYFVYVEMTSAMSPPCENHIYRGALKMWITIRFFFVFRQMMAQQFNFQYARRGRRKLLSFHKCAWRFYHRKNTAYLSLFLSLSVSAIHALLYLTFLRTVYSCYLLHFYHFFFTFFALFTGNKIFCFCFVWDETCQTQYWFKFQFWSTSWTRSSNKARMSFFTITILPETRFSIGESFFNYCVFLSYSTAHNCWAEILCNDMDTVFARACDAAQRASACPL